MAEFVTIEVHKEFERRIEEENTRQNHRITELEIKKGGANIKLT